MPSSPFDAERADAPPVTYRLYIRVPRRSALTPGNLGARVLERGWYVYTGSARRNMAARLRRHLSVTRRRRWHIDWLLGDGPGELAHIELDCAPECSVNAAQAGHAVIPRFGATDCRSGCRSHLLRLGPRRPDALPRDPRRRHTWAAIARAESAHGPRASR